MGRNSCGGIVIDIITDMRVQKAVFWAKSDPDRHGVVSFLAPVEIDCRWEDTSEEYLDAEGNRSTSRAKVYVDRDMERLGALRLGLISAVISQTAPFDPFENTNTYEIRRFDKLPTLDGDEFLRTAFL